MVFNFMESQLAATGVEKLYRPLHKHQLPHSVPRHSTSLPPPPLPSHDTPQTKAFKSQTQHEPEGHDVSLDISCSLSNKELSMCW